MPVIILKRVVFPAPLGPMTPVISPLRAVKETSSSAVMPPNLWVSCLTSSIGRRPSSKSGFQVCGGLGKAFCKPSGKKHGHEDQEQTVDNYVVILKSTKQLGKDREQGRSEKRT